MIYLDHAAATPVCQAALDAMRPYLAEQFFNPSAPYLAAQRVREIYEAAKGELAHVIGAKGPDLIITSGATESINLAFTAAKQNILILATEHAAVRAAAEPYGYQEIAVDRTGLVDLADLHTKLTPDTELISIALASGELGTIQPLAEVAAIVREERARRLAAGDKTPLYLHSDASQALNLLDISVARLGVDLLTLSSPKVYGPKGVGALYVAHGVKLRPLTRGGGQELGLRSGTENVPGVVGFAAAATEAKKHLSSNRKKYTELTQLLRTELAAAQVEPLFLGHKKHQLANFCPVSFPGLDAERLIYQLEQQEIYVSTGAACAASKGERSPALAAIGLSDAEIAGSLRLSLGALNDEENVRTAARAIVAAVDAEDARTHGH